MVGYIKILKKNLFKIKIKKKLSLTKKFFLGFDDYLEKTSFHPTVHTFPKLFTNLSKEDFLPLIMDCYGGSDLVDECPSIITKVDHEFFKNVYNAVDSNFKDLYIKDISKNEVLCKKMLPNIPPDNKEHIVKMLDILLVGDNEMINMKNFLLARIGYFIDSVLEIESISGKIDFRYNKHRVKKTMEKDCPVPCSYLSLNVSGSNKNEFIFDLPTFFYNNDVVDIYQLHKFVKYQRNSQFRDSYLAALNFTKISLNISNINDIINLSEVELDKLCQIVGMSRSVRMSIDLIPKNFNDFVNEINHLMIGESKNLNSIKVFFSNFELE